MSVVQLHQLPCFPDFSAKGTCRTPYRPSLRSCSASVLSMRWTEFVWYKPPDSYIVMKDTAELLPSVSTYVFLAYLSSKRVQIL